MNSEMQAHVAIITKLSPHYVPTKFTISGCDVVLIPGLLPIFLHGCKIKSAWGLGTRLFLLCRHQQQIYIGSDAEISKTVSFT